MNKTKKERPRDWREGRRLRGWELSEQGWKPSKIAEALGVTRGAVSQWLKRGREGGVEALHHRPAPGVQARLNGAQRDRLPELLAQGAEHFGFRGDVWTRERVGEVIRREFGVSYHPTQVGRILKAIKWSRQKPKQRATQRDEAAIQRWREQKWEAIKKKPERRGAR
jgi:transposase